MSSHPTAIGSAWKTCMNNKESEGDYRWNAESLETENREANKKKLDPKLASRIKELGLPEWRALTPEQEQQRVYWVENTKTALISSIFPVMMIPIVWLLYRGPLAGITCEFQSRPLLLNLWPSNAELLADLAKANYSISEKCFFSAMTSTTSAFWMAWLLWRIIRELSRKDTFYMRRWLPVFSIIAPLCVAGAYFLSFDANYSTFAPSLKQPLSISLIKFIIGISVAYYVVAGFIEQALLFLRRDKTVPRYPY
jgi:hypothetical protein